MYSKFFISYQWLSLLSECPKQNLLNSIADLLDVKGSYNIYLIKVLIECVKVKIYVHILYK